MVSDRTSKHQINDYYFIYSRRCIYQQNEDDLLLL